jgi:hypothetical protein
LFDEAFEKGGVLMKTRGKPLQELAVNLTAGLRGVNPFNSRHNAQHGLQTAHYLTGHCQPAGLRAFFHSLHPRL